MSQTDPKDQQVVGPTCIVDTSALLEIMVVIANAYILRQSSNQNLCVSLSLQQHCRIGLVGGFLACTIGWGCVRSKKTATLGATLRPQPEVW